MQERFINYKDPISSFKANQKYSGIIWPNVYCGFDTMGNMGGLTFTLEHDKTGELFTNLDQSISPRTGVWASKQGTIIKEDAGIPLSIVTNAGNNFERMDILVGKHYHDVLYPGGVGANYEIIKGVNGGPVAPNIPDPELSVVLGYFIVKPNATAMSGVTWFRNRAPVPGGQTPALLNEVNRFTNQQQQYQRPTSVQIISQDFELPARGIFQTLDQGNSFVSEVGFGNLDALPNKPDGTVISILFKGNTTIRNYINNLVGGLVGLGVRAGYADGYRNIVLSSVEESTLVILPGQIVTFIKVNTGGAWNTVTQSYVYGDYWKILSVGDSAQRVSLLETNLAVVVEQVVELEEEVEELKTLINNINPPRLMQDFDFIGDMVEHFDATGKAKSTSPYYGRAICNGQNGTPNMKGRFKVSYSNEEFDYSSVGFIGGQKFVTLTIDQMPQHNHGFNMPIYLERFNRGGTDQRYYTNGGNNFGTLSTTNTGGGQSHENRPPYRVVLTLMWIGVG